MTTSTPDLTPAYLRDLARIVDGDMHDHQMTRLATRTALRAAADRLEAADSFDDGYRNGYAVGYSHAEGKYRVLLDHQKDFNA